MTQEHDHFWDLISSMTVCMVTTADGGLLRARPMAPFVDKDARLIQFVTDDDSGKIDELLQDRDICLSFADTQNMKFASVSGRGAITDDKALIEKLWGPYCEVFFPDGPDSVSVITVAASRAEYWDNDTGKLKMAYEFTKAYLTDQGPALGKNAKLAL